MFIKVLIGSADAVRLENEAEVKTLERLFKVPCGVLRHLHTVFCHAQQSAFALEFFTHCRLFAARRCVLPCPADDPPDHCLKSGKKVQFVKVGGKIFSCFDDLFPQPLKPHTNDFAEIGVGVLPLKGTEIFPGVAVILTARFIPETVSCPGKELCFNGVVKVHHPHKFVVFGEITGLCRHIFRKALGDPQGICQFQIESIIFNSHAFRKNFPAAGGFYQSGDPLIHDTLSFCCR